MAGSATNVQLWTQADVLVYDTATTVYPTADIPTDASTAFVQTTGKWTYLGLLVGDAGVDQAREWSEKDIPAWGYGTILIARKDFKLTTKVSTLEDNAIMQKILWPGSTSSNLPVPVPIRRFIAFEKRTASGGVNRLISKAACDIWVPNIKDVEGDVTPREVSVRVFPDSSYNLYTLQSA